MSKKPKQTKWSLSVDTSIKGPKNPHHLDAVLDHLGPFRYQTRAEALAARAESDAPSRELAIELVEETASVFNTASYLVNGAPRFKHTVGALSTMQQLADALCSHLNSLDDITRHQLQCAGVGEEFRGPFIDLMKAADAHGLPRKSTEQIDDPSPWVYRLSKLSAYAEVTRTNLIELRRRENRSEKDVGGNTNLWKEDVGVPRWGLVTDALKIYELFKPDKARATIGGKFHQFAQDLFEYATGKDASVHAKVDDCVKSVVKATRQDKALEEKEDRLEAEQWEIFEHDPGLSKEANYARINEIRNELAEISHRRRPLWQKMYPHLRLASLFPNREDRQGSAPTATLAVDTTRNRKALRLSRRS